MYVRASIQGQIHAASQVVRLLATSATEERQNEGSIEQIWEDLAQESIQDLDDKWRRQLIDPRDVIEQENYCTNSSIQSLDFEYDERAVSMAQKEQITDVCGLFRQKFIDGLNSKYG